MVNTACYTGYIHTTPNGKRYVGITSTKPTTRWQGGKGYKKCPVFWNAIIKYGWRNVVHEVPVTGMTKEEAVAWEIETIALYRSNERACGYNINPGGHVISQETKEKVRLALLGHVISQETKDKISQSLLGTVPTSEARANMSKAHLGNTNSLGKNTKPVICIETGNEYESVSQAAKELGGPTQSLSGHLNGAKSRKTFKGYTFEYKKELVAA